MGFRRRWRGRVPYVVIDAAVISVDDRNGGSAREKCDSQKQRYGDRGRADMACDFCFHKAFAFTFPSENFYRRCKNFSEPEFFCRGLYGLRGIATQTETKRETVEQHRVYHVVAHAAVH